MKNKFLYGQNEFGVYRAKWRRNHWAIEKNGKSAILRQYGAKNLVELEQVLGASCRVRDRPNNGARWRVKAKENKIFPTQLIFTCISCKKRTRGMMKIEDDFVFIFCMWCGACISLARR